MVARLVSRCYSPRGRGGKAFGWRWRRRWTCFPSGRCTWGSYQKSSFACRQVLMPEMQTRWSKRCGSGDQPQLSVHLQGGCHHKDCTMYGVAVAVHSPCFQSKPLLANNSNNSNDQAQTNFILSFAPTIASATSLLHQSSFPIQRHFASRLSTKQAAVLSRQVKMAPPCEFAFSSPPPLFPTHCWTRVPPPVRVLCCSATLRPCDPATLPLNSLPPLILLPMDLSSFVACLLPVYI